MSVEKSVNINKNIAEDPSINYAMLRKEGIRRTQELSGKIWTDYNHHDPGVTILEHLCFALTDLGYRTNFKIEDILNARRKREGHAAMDTFFDPIQILPSAPISLSDYRILLIDGIPEIKNVWVEAVKDNEQGIKGLYRILVQLKEEPDTKAELLEIIAHIRELFNNNRNLCEDLAEIKVLKADRITLSADIDIESDVIPEAVLAEIYFRLEEQLVMATRVYTLKELVAEGLDYSQIFDGPLTNNGFLKPSELKPLPSEIYISNLIETISQVKGVRSIRNFQIYLNEIPVEGDIITIAEGYFPFLDNRLEHYLQKNEPYPITFHHGNLQDTLDLSTVFQLLYNLLQSDHGGYKVQKNRQLYKQPEVDLGTLGKYYSIQQSFPKNYGIGEYGLANKAPQNRRAYAKQLKAYLAFFEQIMANYLAQLANIDLLFSIEESLDQTYFSQTPDDIPNYDNIAVAYNTAYSQNLEALTRKFDPFTERRNRFLNHLLARFGELFPTEFLTAQNGQEGELKMIKAKIKLLQDYPQLSANRSKGFNYSATAGKVEQAAIKQKMGILFHIEDCSDRNLASLIDEDEIEQFSATNDELNVENIATDKTRKVDSYNYIAAADEEKANEALDYESDFIFSSDEDNLLQLLLHYGIHPKNYSILPASNGKLFQVVFECPKVSAVKVFEAKTKMACTEAIDQLADHLKKLNKQSEGFHLIEHILLRQKHVKKYRFELMDARGEVTLVAHQAAELETQRVLVNDLLLIGVKAENYEIIEEDSVYAILLYDGEDLPIARVSKTFADLDQAEEGIQKMVDYLQELKKDNQAIYSRVEFYIQGNQDHLLTQTPYSLRMSVVLPAWPQRFQNADFRQLFESTFSENAPANLTLQFLWLDLKDMHQFEELYQPWLAEKMKEEPRQPDLDELSYALLSFLVSP